MKIVKLKMIIFIAYIPHVNEGAFRFLWVILCVSLFIVVSLMFSKEDEPSYEYLKQDSAVVVNKIYSLPKVTNSYILVGKAIVPKTVDEPEKYSLEIKYNNEQQVLDVSKKEYEQYVVGDKIMIDVYQRTQKNKNKHSSLTFKLPEFNQ